MAITYVYNNILTNAAFGGRTQAKLQPSAWDNFLVAFFSQSNTYMRRRRILHRGFDNEVKYLIYNDNIGDDNIEQEIFVCPPKAKPLNGRSKNQSLADNFLEARFFYNLTHVLHRAFEKE